MRLKEISLSWFRGAAESAVLRTSGKSVVVYGPNGSGKTSFVDGLEFLISGGKVGHLAHEYSGRRLEHSAPNTHAPPSAPVTVRVVLDDDAIASCRLDKEKTATFANPEILAGWSLDRLVLRQSQVADFIQADKADKYSKLLPIIGLARLEAAAIDLAALAKEVERSSSLERLKDNRARLRSKWLQVFQGMNATAVDADLLTMHRRYLPDLAQPADRGTLVRELTTEITVCLGKIREDQRRHALLQQAQRVEAPTRLEEVFLAASAAAARSEMLLGERLAVLRTAVTFSNGLAGEGTIDCPACGQAVEVLAFRNHVASEAVRLAEALNLHADLSATRGRLATAVQTLRATLASAELADWVAGFAGTASAEHLAALAAVDPDSLRADTSGLVANRLAGAIRTIHAAIEAAALLEPTDPTRLTLDDAKVKTAGSRLEIDSLAAKIAEADVIVAFVRAAEQGVRAEIRERTVAILGEVSKDVARMWGILHPGEAIDGVHLYQGENADKAIDVAVRFHGLAQLSPRLTLSEGHRNSLGLCVFLAIASRGGDMPLVMDDVVTSFDREHRGNVVDLLNLEFASRQVILFTHDHEWFLELSQRLSRAHWSFQALRPQADPVTGIRWSGHVPGFEAARASLEVAPLTAANAARGVMDIQMSMICGRLSVPVPHVHGAYGHERNAGDLLSRFASRSRVKFRKAEPDGTAVRYDTPAAFAIALGPLLTTWANSGSHGRYVSRGEAERLIDHCEAFIAAMACSTCKEAVWYAKAEGGGLQCGCGGLKWLK